ncbi:MAG: SpoIIE family protein phosphatase [Planctomycetia bacterium]|nr:SpoIIE family protein phosphatase [Planctomycetia bacterium]
MLKLRIFLTVLVPALILTPLLLFFYVRSEKERSYKAEFNELESNVRELGFTLAQNADSITKQIELFTSMLSSPQKMDLDSIFRRAMDEIPGVSAIIICYAPEFLQEVREGKHSRSYLNIFSKCPLPETIPHSFAPTIYRDPQNRDMVYMDSACNYYETLDFYLLPKLSREGFWSDPFKGNMSGLPVSAYGLPFWQDGVQAGVITCLVKIEALFDSQLLNDFVGKGKARSRLFLFGQSGEMVYATKNSPVKSLSLYSIVDQLGRKDLYPEMDKMVRNVSGTMRIDYAKNTQSKDNIQSNVLYIYSKPRNRAHWTIVGAFDEGAIHSEINSRLMKFALGAFFSIFGLCSLISVLLIRGNKPLIIMTQVAEKVSQGDLDVRVPKEYEHKHGSIGKLVQSYNGMIASLRSHISKEVEDSVQKAHIQKELSISQDLQQTFLPANKCRFFPDRGYALSGDLIPAKYVAGDFFDFWRVNDDIVGVVIGDVSGKGVPASMVMVATSTLIRMVASKNLTPGEVVNEVNRVLLQRNKRGMFVTLFLAFYYFKTGELHYCNAGHNKPAIVKKNGFVQFFDYPENSIIGILPDSKFVTCVKKLEPSDLLFLYTDGLTDATAANGDQYGDKRLEQLLVRLSHTPTEQFIGAVEEEIKNFQGESQTDDMTMLILKRMEDITQCWTCHRRIPSKYGAENATIEEIMGILSKQGWSDHDLFAVETGLTEGIRNAIEHGNKFDEAKTVHLSCCVSDTKISISIRDEGLGFAEEKVDDPREKEHLDLPSGRGILLTRGFMTRVWFNESGNEIFMQKIKSKTPHSA